MKGILLEMVVVLGALGLAQPTACEVVSDAATTAVIGSGFVRKSTPMKGEGGQGMGTVCSRRKGKQLVQVTLLPGATDKGMSLQDMLKEQTKEAAEDSDSSIKIIVLPQTGVGDEAFSATVEAAQIKFSNVAVHKGKTMLFVQVFGTANTLADALKLAKDGASGLP